ncbi:MAG: alpha/beta hydrolase fold domain-containing protein [Phycisphaerales bacterium]
MHSPNHLFPRLVTAGAICLASAALARQPDDAPRARGLLSLPASVAVTRDIEYARPTTGKPLLLDVYLPKQEKPDAAEPRAATTPKPTPLPVIIWIHGGGWESGTKNGCPAAQLVPHGYAAVSISYRFSQVAPYPAQIHDCKAAVRWVRAHAKEYNFDPDHIGVWGASAGGHLVALLGTTARDKQLEGDLGDCDEQSSAVQAVCDWFGPTDLIRLCRMAGGESADQAAQPRTGFTPPPRHPDHASTSDPDPAAQSDKPSQRPGASNADSPDDAGAKRPRVPTPGPIFKLLGGKIESRLALADSANPISFVDKSDAPFLIVHGDADTLVPIDQSDLLLAALKHAGVDARLHVVKGGGHGFWNADLLRIVREFFDAKLKPSPQPPAPTPHP